MGLHLACGHIIINQAMLGSPGVLYLIRQTSKGGHGYQGLRTKPTTFDYIRLGA